MNERHKSCGAHRKSDRGIGERVVRSIRTECLGHTIVINERHLHALFAEYVNYYNLDRPHRSLGLQSPLPRSPKANRPDARRSGAIQPPHRSTRGGILGSVKPQLTDRVIGARFK